MKKDNIIRDKSFSFAIRIVRLYQYLKDKDTPYVLLKQLLKSGTSIGANIREAIRGQSRKDFVAKMNISLKEVSETEYWLELLYQTGYMTNDEFESIYSDCTALAKLLMSIVKTSNTEDEKADNYEL